MPDIAKIIESVKSQQNLSRIKQDQDRYFIFNGQLKDIIRGAIQKEFLLPETVADMAARIIPINITQKIISKLAKVYREDPIRKPIDLNDNDQEALDFYVKELDFNRKMKHANKMFKLHKHVSIEPFVSSDGKPMIRILPSQTYSLYSDDQKDPTKVTTFIKHIKFDSLHLENERHELWTNENFWIVDGEGNIVQEEMNYLNNPEGLNPYGVIPFTLIRETDDLLIPISDDDLVNMQIAINLLLTDLAFATKYQSWSIFYLIGVNNEKISFNPNSVITLDHAPGTEKPEIGTIKPQLDSDAMLRQVEALVSMLLTTKSLSVGSISGQIQASNPASGIAKVLDQSETTEERSEQVAFFKDSEKEFWWKFSQYILPAWIKAGALNREYVYPFSQDFELAIIFPDQRPSLSEKEKLELLKMKLEMGVITMRDVIKTLHPDLSDLEVDSLLANIAKEKLDSIRFMQRNLPMPESSEEDESQDESEEDENGDPQDSD